MPDQVKRLSVIFILVISALVIVRYLLIPPTFGKLGHYRARALEDAKALPVKYAGREACLECHDDVGDALGKSYHRGLSCEVCHGPGAKHVKSEGDVELVVPGKRKDCLRCHQFLSSRPTGFPQVDPLQHNPVKPCITCHDPHEPGPPRAPADCSGCHTTIAKIKGVSRHVSLKCETCHTTKAQHKLDPRKFRASIPAEREFCGKCHAKKAKGSSDIPQVDIRLHGGRYLCWECHNPHNPQGE